MIRIYIVLIYALFCLIIKSLSSKLIDHVLIKDSPIFVTYTTGNVNRIKLTINLIKSVHLHSVQLYSNSVVVCLDKSACTWCKSQALTFLPSQKSCYCIEYSSKPSESDTYASKEWSDSVLKKIQILKEFVQTNLSYGIFSDHDVVVKSSLDDIFHQNNYNYPIITMCDFPKMYRPENKMANTGFMLIKNSPEAREMIYQWVNITLNSPVEVTNDQPIFQEVAKMKAYLKWHRCSDEKEGFAMWFHKKKISGSGLNKKFYYNNNHLIKVFHANDILSSSQKIEVLKKLNMWYINESSVATSTEINALPEKNIKNSKFYIYDWPSRVINIFDYKNKWRNKNYGAGPLIDAGIGYFNTYMHSLFPIVYSRLVRHPRRTLDPIEASWIFIPYDISSDAYLNSNMNLAAVLAYLNKSSYFNHLKGKDHFFIDSSEPFWYEKKVVVTKFYTLCKLCKKYTPSYLPAPYQKWQKDFTVDDTWVAIPYTSAFHYYEKDSMEERNYNWAWEFDVLKKRENLISLIGIIKKMVPTATKLRRILFKQCKDIDQNTQVNDSSHFNNTCYHKILNSQSWKNFGDEALVYLNSTFCLLPTGDIPSRKALFDILLAGCIPVIFDMRQINLYKLHIENHEIENLCYYFDIKTVLLNKVNVVTNLLNIPYQEIISKRKSIKKIVWKLQYALPSNKNNDSYVPPIPDALEIIINNLLNE